MMMAREPVTAEMMAAEVVVATTTVERRSGSEAAAAKMHTASTVTTSAKMHAAPAVATAAKMTATTAAATTTATMAVHLRGQAFRDLLGHTRCARIDQWHRPRRFGGDVRHHEQRRGSKPKMDQATPRIEKSDHPWISLNADAKDRAYEWAASDVFICDRFKWN
jgi:hypothetical protein